MTDQTVDRTRLPIRRPQFAGVTKKTLEGSEPDWNQAAHVTPPERAPNAGSAALIAIYESGDADKVKQAIPNAIRSSIAQIDKGSAKELKAGLEEASAGLAG